MRITLILWFGLYLNSSLIGQVSNPCNPALLGESPPKGELDYRQRSPQLCEGLVVVRVSGTTDVKLVGFTKAKVPADPLQKLKVEWHAPAGATVSLHASQTKPRQLYYMDYYPKAGETALEWDLTNLQKADVPVSSVAFLARAVAKGSGNNGDIGGRAEVIIPAVLGRAGKSGPEYFFTFLSKVRNSGFSGKLTPLSSTNYPDGKRKTIPLDSADATFLINKPTSIPVITSESLHGRYRLDFKITESGHRGYEIVEFP